MELTQEYAEQYMNNAIEEFHEIFLNKGFDPLSGAFRLVLVHRDRMGERRRRHLAHD